MLICLVGCLHKILPKVLAARLKRVLPKVVSRSETTFVPGRKLINGVLVLNEILDLEKKNRKECLLLKVNFEQA